MEPLTVVQYRTPRLMRTAVILLAVAVVGLLVAVGILFAYMLSASHYRSQQQADFEQRFTASMCRVLADLPADAPALVRVRSDLHCTQPGTTEVP